MEYRCRSGRNDLGTPAVIDDVLRNLPCLHNFSSCGLPYHCSITNVETAYFHRKDTEADEFEAYSRHQTMANVARSSLRRFTTQAARQATVSYAAPAAEQVNQYGINVSQAQGTVNSLTGGKTGGHSYGRRSTDNAQLSATHL